MSKLTILQGSKYLLVFMITELQSKNEWTPFFTQCLNNFKLVHEIFEHPKTLDNSDRQFPFQKMKLIKNELSWLASAKKIAIKNWTATGGLQPSLQSRAWQLLVLGAFQPLANINVHPKLHCATYLRTLSLPLPPSVLSILRLRLACN